MSFRCEYTAWEEGGTTWVGFDLVWLGGWRQIRRVTDVEGGVDGGADKSVFDVF
jgi:chitodextrinase